MTENDFPCCAPTGFGISLYPTEPTYTAAEVKVLTETAGKVAYALGRKDAGEEIALALEEYLPYYSEEFFPADGTSVDCIAAKAMRHAYPNAARIARETVSQPQNATSDATSGVPGHPEVSEGPQVLHKPFPDDGVTYCGWATGSQIIDGCGEVWPCATVRAREVSETVRSPQEPPKLVCRRCNGYGLLGVAAGVNPVPCPDCAKGNAP